MVIIGKLGIVRPIFGVIDGCEFTRNEVVCICEIG
jgi:hypothetical protein